MKELKLSTQTRGKLGELQVVVELLTRGYQVYSPLSDEGIDLLILKENLQPCFLQVKYSKWYPKQKCYFQQLFIKSFNRVLSEKTFCIFVLGEDGYIIVPYNYIKDNCKIYQNKRYMFMFKMVDGKVMDSRNKVDFTAFLNKWEILEDKNGKSSNNQ